MQHYPRELVALSPSASALARAFPRLEVLWYKPGAHEHASDLLPFLSKLVAANPGIDIVLCLAKESPLASQWQASFDAGIAELVFSEELNEQAARLGRVHAALRQRRREREEAERVQRGLEATLRHKNEQLAWLNHEIRTPLNGLMGLIEMLEGSLENDEQKEMLAVMERCSQTILSHVSDMLDLAKIEAAKMRLECESFSLRQVVEDALLLYARQAQAKGLLIAQHRAPELPERLLGDGRKLAQIMNNLISNAIKFTPRGHIDIVLSLAQAASRESCTLRLEVRDSGFGIAEKDLGRLFTPFEQTAASRLYKGPGSGIGLALCKQLIELMGGSIAVTSQLGEGTSFVVHLPFAREGVALAHEKSSPLAEPTRGELPTRPLLEKRILVVDDDPLNLRVAKRQLSRFATHISVAQSGLEALALLEKQDFDLILVDRQMPEMDGSQLLHVLRRLPDRQEMAPVVALTALSGADDRRRLLAEGFDDYLAKPAQLEDMARLLERWLPHKLAPKSS